jgi:hypothetical protein
MRTFMAGTLAAVTLALCVSSDASAADWRYRGRVRYDHGRRVVYGARYWAPPVVVTTPAPLVADPVDCTGYFYSGLRYYPYRSHYRGHYHHGHYHRR